MKRKTLLSVLLCACVGMNSFSLPVLAQDAEEFVDVPSQEIAIQEETADFPLFEDGSAIMEETGAFTTDAVSAAPDLMTGAVGAEEGIAVNEINFPDAVFRQYVSSEYDLTKNGFLDSEEILAAVDMDVNELGIGSLKGVEFLTSMGLINCSSNSLTSLDLSKNTQLTSLDCSDNQLTSLDLSANVLMQELDVSNNQLTSLDVSGMPQLTSLDCGDNQITVLNTSNNPALTELDCGGNQITALDCSNNTALTELACSDNAIKSLNVSSNTQLTELDCSDNELESLNLGENASLSRLDCSNNSLEELDLSKNPGLTELDCGDNSLVSLNISNNPALTQVSFEGNDELAHLDVGDNKAILKNVEVPAAVKAKAQLKRGAVFTYKGIKYKILGNEKDGVKVAVVKPSKKSVTAVTIPDTVTYKKITCQVSAIGDKAFYGCKKLKKVTLGVNVTSIGKQAFYGCKGMNSLTIRSKKLKTAGGKCLGGISAKAVIKVPKARLKAYKKLLKGKGQSKTVVIKK